MIGFVLFQIPRTSGQVFSYEAVQSLRRVTSRRCQSHYWGIFIFVQGCRKFNNENYRKWVLLQSFPTCLDITVKIFLTTTNILLALQSDPHAQHIILNLDWSALNGHSQCNYTIPDYSTAARNTECIGKQRSIVEFLNEIVVHFGLTFKQVTLIGFSLGCHLAGSLADTIYDSRSLRVGRIEGDNKRVLLSPS